MHTYQVHAVDWASFQVAVYCLVCGADPTYSPWVSDCEWLDDFESMHEKWWPMLPNSESCYDDVHCRPTGTLA